MPKLLSSTALALVLAAPVWAQAAPGPVANQDSYASASPTLEAHRGAVLAQTTDTPEAAEEEQVPDITESQPGVTTGDELEEEEGGVETGASGSTGESGEAGSGGDTAEGGRGGAGTGTGSGDGTGGGDTGGGDTGGGAGGDTGGDTGGGAGGGASDGSGGSDSGSGD